jgi:hypothetical protein
MPSWGFPDNLWRRRVVGPADQPPVAMVTVVAVAGIGDKAVVGVALIGVRLEFGAGGIDPLRDVVLRPLGATAVPETWILGDEIQVVRLSGHDGRRSPVNRN